MNNNEKKTNVRVLTIFLSITVLLVLILILLYNFGTISRQTAKSDVADEMTKESADFASQIHDELDVMIRMSVDFREQKD